MLFISLWVLELRHTAFDVLLFIFLQLKMLLNYFFYFFVICGLFRSVLFRLQILGNFLDIC